MNPTDNYSYISMSLIKKILIVVILGSPLLILGQTDSHNRLILSFD